MRILEEKYKCTKMVTQTGLTCFNNIWPVAGSLRGIMPLKMWIISGFSATGPCGNSLIQNWTQWLHTVQWKHLLMD